ncbi:MAG: putative ABC transporter permease [Clostridia bacterium]|nr:putative ABC transporter permease [Clostridia bacterium]
MKHSVQKKIKLARWQTYILYFFIFAFMGWLMETIYALFSLGHFVKRGFLYGPICPIYGYGALMLILFLGKYKHKDLPLFIYAAIIFSTFEYIVSFGLDALFSMHWWDYTGEFMNLNGRISAFYSFAWGIIAILFINHIYPFLKKKLNLILSKIPYGLQSFILKIFSFTFILDTVASCVRYLV